MSKYYFNLIKVWLRSIGTRANTIVDTGSGKKLARSKFIDLKRQYGLSLSTRDIIGLYFFENSQENNVKMLWEFLTAQVYEFEGYTSRTWNDKLKQHIVRIMWIYRWLKICFFKNFSRRWYAMASKNSNPTPCDFFLWQYLKSRVYLNKPWSVPIKGKHPGKNSHDPSQWVFQSLRCRLLEC